MRAAVVIPSVRPALLREFIAAWQPASRSPDVRLIVVEDNPTRTPDMVPGWAEHYCWEDIDRDLGDKASCIPRQDSGVRDYGYWLAGKDPSIDMIVSLDDDVRPIAPAFLSGHWEALNTPYALRWFNTMQDGQYPRGYPYAQQKGGVFSQLNHGLWTGSPDLDAYAELRDPHAYATAPTIINGLVPPGMYYPNCAMNYAFRREVAPFCYQPILPDGMKRWGDIWSGVIFKRIADVHGWAVTSGYPCVRHERASDPLNNLRQEMLGYGINERLWQAVDWVHPLHTSPLGTYRRLAEEIGNAFPELKGTSDAMLTWASLWDGGTTQPMSFTSSNGTDWVSALPNGLWE